MNSTNPIPEPSTSDQINDLVARYRGGDRSAAEELLTRFDRYLGKWLRLLTSGRWDPRDREVRHFLIMMGSVDINATAHILSRRLKAYERADLEQEAKVALLETALRYGNIHGQFRFVLRRRVMAMIHDPVVFGASHNLQYTEACEVPVHDAEELNAAWIEGLTCGRGFDELTADERRIILLNKQFGFTIEQTAKILGISPATVNRAIHRTKVVLAVHYLDK